MGSPFTEVVEAHLDHFAALLQERQGRVDAAPGESVLERQVPLALVLRPAAAAATHGHFRLVFGRVPHEKLPVAVLDRSHSRRCGSLAAVARPRIRHRAPLIPPGRDSRCTSLHSPRNTESSARGGTP